MEIALGILFVLIAAIPVVYLLNDKRLKKQKRPHPRYTKDQAVRLFLIGEMNDDILDSLERGPDR